MNHPHVMSIERYAESQWVGIVYDLCSLIVTGWDTDAEIAAAARKWGIHPDEIPAALIDAELELEKGWGRAQAA